MVIVEFPEKNITLINFNELFQYQIGDNIYKDLKKYGLLDKPLTNKDVKKLFYHHVIFGITETILNGSYEGKPVFLLTDSYFNKQIDLCKCYHEQGVIEFITNIIIKLETMIPVRVVYITANTPSSMVMDASIQKVKNVSNKDFTFQKIKQFAKRNELTFLSNDYLNRFKTKQIMI
jgi:hypothetical protein